MCLEIMLKKVILEWNKCTTFNIAVNSQVKFMM